MMNIVQPWAQKNSNGVEDARLALVEEFKMRFGDPNDPAVAEKLTKEAEAAIKEWKDANQQAEEDAQKIAAISSKSRRIRGKRK
jgi:hypothetical protein